MGPQQPAAPQRPAPRPGRGPGPLRPGPGRLLKGLGFSLLANQKRLTGPPHPDRDCQFGDIGRVRRRFLKAGLPVISVDAKKKVEFPTKDERGVNGYLLRSYSTGDR